MKLGGEFTVTSSKGKVYQMLTDPRFVGNAVPDLENLEIHSEDSFGCELRVGLAHMKGPMMFEFKIVEKQYGQRARFVGNGNGMGSLVDVDTSFRLREIADGQTAVEWEGEAKIGGKLASISGGLLNVIAKKNAEKFVASLRDYLQQASQPFSNGENEPKKSEEMKR